MLTSRALGFGQRGEARPPRALDAHPVRASDLADARSLVATQPATSIHVATLVEPAAPMRGDLACVEVIREGGRPLALAQRRRGISFVVDERHADDDALYEPLSRFVRRAYPASEVVFGPERVVRGVLSAGRRRGVAPLEIRNQEFMQATPLVSARATVGEGGAPRDLVLRHARNEDLTWLLEAHARMCIEDLGIDQVAMHRSAYRDYFVELIAHGRSRVGTIGGEPVFKLEIPIESRGAWLVEGVFTEPGWRGRGIASAGVARVSAEAGTSGRVACLYVHRRNGAARRLYRGIGFRPVSPWVTALLGRSERARSTPKEI